MLRFRTPSESAVISYLLAQAQGPLSYDAVGGTESVSPRGFCYDRKRVLLGYGGEVFALAVEAIRAWRMCPEEMTTVFWRDRPIAVGTTVGIAARVGPVFTLNPCRIVYVIDERRDEEETQRFGFANGTLPGHIARGEERFLVEWNRHDNSVWYDLSAFSRPDWFLAWLAYPFVRYVQARFQRLSGVAMQKAISAEQFTRVT